MSPPSTPMWGLPGYRRLGFRVHSKIVRVTKERSHKLARGNQVWRQPADIGRNAYGRRDAERVGSVDPSGELSISDMLEE
jgi:hypothetical protein